MTKAAVYVIAFCLAAGLLWPAAAFVGGMAVRVYQPAFQSGWSAADYLIGGAQ